MEKQQSEVQTDSERDKGKHSRGREEWKKCCPRSKPAESPLFFQLGAAANSAHSDLAYRNKASWEITVETPHAHPALLLCPLPLISFLSSLFH